MPQFHSGMWTDHIFIFSQSTKWTRMNIRTFFISTAERHQYTQFFKFKSTNINLLSLLIYLSDKMADMALWLVRLLVNRVLCEGSITLHKSLEYLHVLPCYQQTYLESLSGEVLLGDPDGLLGWLPFFILIRPLRLLGLSRFWWRHNGIN